MSKDLKSMVNRLAEEIHQGNDKAWYDLYTCLEDTRKSIVYHYRGKYINFNVSNDDLEEAFNLALVQAIQQYRFDEQPEVPFYNYFLCAANTECKAVLRRSQGGSRKVYCDYTSFSAPASTSKDGDSVTFGDMLQDNFNLEESTVDKLYITPIVEDALSKLKQKDADIIRIHMAYENKKERKAKLISYLNGAKDATVRKNVQRARERFSKALKEAGYIC